MGDCPFGTLVILLIHVMMDDASNGLKDESSDDDNTDNGVSVLIRELNAG